MATLALLVPWNKVSSFRGDKVVIDIDEVKNYQGEPADEALLLKDHILDKKILDLEDTEVEVVYDLQLVQRANKLYVTAVDSSRYGRWRRLGFRRTADQRQAADPMHKNMIPWTIVQPLPPNMSSFRGEVKLKILKEKLAEMQPADIADILEELDQHQRLIVFDQLETEHASDTLEQVDPNVQRDLVSIMQKDRVVELINEMTSGQAADLLSALPHDESETLMSKINPNLAAKVRSIMEKVEEKAINYATSRFIRVPGDRTTDEIQNDYPKARQGQDGGHVLLRGRRERQAAWGARYQRAAGGTGRGTAPGRDGDQHNHPGTRKHSEGSIGTLLPVRFPGDTSGG